MRGRSPCVERDAVDMSRRTKTLYIQRLEALEDVIKIGTEVEMTMAKSGLDRGMSVFYV